ncbi:MAG: error-prone DNA polymerase [Proteobacteria bacterium]|nr:error-prone DNA polymerase [Pseudomonadota bacterium]
MPPYAELHCLSNFSFLRGASHPEELVDQAVTFGYRALAVTDECSLAGVVRAHMAARAQREVWERNAGTVPRPDAPLALIVGSEFTLADGLKLVLLATDRDSYGDLAQLITQGRRRAVKGHYVLTRDDVAALGTRCQALWVPGPHRDGTRLAGEARFVAEAFGRTAAIAFAHHARGDEAARLATLTRISRASGLALVAAGDVHMHVRARRMLQDTLTAIRLKKPLAACGHALFPNGEHALRSRGRLATLYPPALMAATVALAERCRFSLDELRYEYPEEIVPAGKTAIAHLRDLVAAGALQRYAHRAPDPAQPVPAKVTRLLAHELALIEKLRYEPFFLTVHDIVVEARRLGILCQGRGSAANSAVCYVLGITEVDPALQSTLVGRFMSEERKGEPPDIDVDFEHQRREEVMQYVYNKYGRERTALAATVICYRAKSAVRDVGKALGIEPAQLDRLCRLFAWWDRREIADERLREAGFDPAAPIIRLLTDLVDTLQGFPRHLSQHVGGFVIARDRIDRLVPIENAAMNERTMIEWDKDDLEALGLIKVDCLALGMLSAIRRALEMISGTAGHTVTMADIPPHDDAVYAMLQKADTIGVFQVESRAQQSMLPRLKPACFYDLVVEIAIVRPGPIQGGMVHPYLKRRRERERDPDVKFDYPSPAIENVLGRTLGVPIFQEQVMQLAIEAAGFTEGEADQLRRSMAAWKRKGGLEKYEGKLRDGMLARGYSAAFAGQLFEQIKGFGEYGFPESHSASFAKIAYVSAWLKLYHPAAFTGALLNSQPMGFYAPSQLIQDARRHGVVVLDADVKCSAWDCELGSDPVFRGSVAHPPSRETGSDPLRLGLRMIKGLSEAAGQRIVAARAERPFADVADLAHRAALDRRELAALANGRALASLAGDRHRAAWKVAGIEHLPGLLAGAPLADADVALEPPTAGQDLVADYRHLGYTLGPHPAAMLRDRLAARRLVTAEQVAATPTGRIVRTAGIVVGRQRPGTAGGVVFVTLEDETGSTNVIVWRDLGERQRKELLTARLMAVYGKVERDGVVVHLIAEKLVDLTPMLGPLETRSRDFH